jgi:hypothetical protein
VLPHVQLSTKPLRYPSAIPTSGLKLWVNADNYAAGTTITNGQIVPAVNNQFNLGGNVVATGSTNVVNWYGGKAFDFSQGDSNWFQTANNAGITGNSSSTIILVGAPYNGTTTLNATNYNIGISWGGTGTYTSRAIATANNVIRTVHYVNDPVGAIPISYNRPAVYSVRDNSTSTIFNSTTYEGNDTTLTSRGYALNTIDGPVRIGLWKDGGNYRFGYIAEALVYDRYLTDAEILSIQTYFKAKHSIPGGYAASFPAATTSELNYAWFPTGNYIFRAGTMTGNQTLEVGAVNYYDSARFAKVFSSPFRSTATLNKVDVNIPFNKILVQRNDGVYKGLVRFGSNQVYNTTSNVGLLGDSGINTGNWSPRTTVATRVILGIAGGHGIYSLAQNSCSWGSADSAVGAGWTGATCGAYPNDLAWGTGVNDAAQYTNLSGTWEHWIAW